MPSKLPKPETLMLIDDSRFDRLIISRTIEHTKIFSRIIVFPGGKEALDYIIENINTANKLPQLILLDIQMPEMNGFEFMEQFDGLPPSFKNSCKVVMLSSTDDLSDIAKVGADKNITRLLKKPLHPSELVILLNENYEMQ